jgi:hypothetical protein
MMCPTDLPRSPHLWAPILGALVVTLLLQLAKR